MKKILNVKMAEVVSIRDYRRLRVFTRTDETSRL